MSGIGQFLWPDPGRRDEFRGHPVSQGDGSRLVEEQYIYVTRRLDSPPAGGQYIAAHEAVNAGNADSAEESADGRGNQADNEGQQDRERGQDNSRLAGGTLIEHRKGWQGQDYHDEQDRQADQDYIERDFIRGFLASGAFNHGDHPVQEGVARLGGNPYYDAITDDPGSPGDGTAVSTAFPDNRRRFAGDGGFIHRCDALNNLPVGGNNVPGLTDKQIAYFQVIGDDRAFPALVEAAGHGGGSHFA